MKGLRKDTSSPGVSGQLIIDALLGLPTSKERVNSTATNQVSFSLWGTSEQQVPSVIAILWYKMRPDFSLIIPLSTPNSSIREEPETEVRTKRAWSSNTSLFYPYIAGVWFFLSYRSEFTKHCTNGKKMKRKHELMIQRQRQRGEHFKQYMV